MVNIDKAKVPGLTGRQLLDQIGYHNCVSHGQKRYVLAIIAGIEWWTSLSGSDVTLRKSLNAPVCWRGKLDEPVSKYQRHDVVASVRERMATSGYEILADIHGWRVTLLGEILKDSGYKADPAGTRYAKPDIRRHMAYGWRWAISHWKNEQG